MKYPITRIMVGAAAALTLALSVAGCAGDAGPDISVPPADNGVSAGDGSGDESDSEQRAAEVISEALDGPDGKDERAFGASRDMVVTAVESTFKSNNAKAEWSDSTLRVAMDGSIEAPTSASPCLALEALLTDGEEAVIDYDDGEFRCADWRTM